MRAASEDHLLQRARLPCDRPGDARLGVAEQVGPPAAHRVESAAAVVADQPGAVAAGDRQQRQGVRVFAHLRAGVPEHGQVARSEEHTSELQSLMRISYAVFCLKKKKSTDNKSAQ